MSQDNEPPLPTAGSPAFRTTLWERVRLAGRADGLASDEAVEQLCQVYWYPIYAFARRMGSTVPEAQDLTQDFFKHLLQSDLFHRADPSVGRFRSFLLKSFKNFVGQARIKARAAKRGGNCEFVTIRPVGAESRYQIEPMDHRSADRLFDRSWAITLVERALQRLEDEAQQAGRGLQFKRLQGFLLGDSQEGYAAASRDLGLSEGALRVTVHRLRARCRELFCDELAQTITSAADFDAELRHLLSVLAE